MFVELAAAVALTASGAAPAGDKPLREVVFKVSYTRRQEIAAESFGGLDTSANNATGDSGTITVDIMAVQGNTLGVKLTELWKSKGRSATFLGNVAPDGSVNFADQPISAVARDVLPFFAPLFATDRSLDPGSAWTINFKGTAADVQTRFAVRSVEGPVVQLDETQTLKLKSARGLDSTTTGQISYKPSLLVPLSGSFSQHEGRSGMGATNRIWTVYNFERVSDTRDSAP